MYYRLVLALAMLALNGALLQAQEVDTTYASQMNYIFQHLDKTKVPYGLLKDISFELADLNYYRGTILMDSNRVFIQNFRDIFKTMYTAMIHPSAAVNLPNPDVVDSIWFARRKPGQVTLAGLYYKYSRFADDAPNKVTIVNDQVYDKYINGVWQNPYQTEQVIGFTPANVEYAGLNFNLLLPSELWLSNQKAQVSKIQVDAGDGLGFRTLNPNVYLPVMYADSGLKVLKFKVWMNNNTYVQSHSLLHVSNSPYVFTPTAPIPVDQELVFSLVQQPGGEESFLPPPACITGNAGADHVEQVLMSSSESWNGKFAKGLITIKYAQEDHQLRKPLIIAEGFDPGFYSNPEDIRGVNTFEGFENSIFKSNELNNLLFNTDEYDIIYIDWQNGTEDLRLNALLLKTVIQCINSKKVPNGLNGIEKNVVLGQSMGGVIARYALKKMEDEGLNHDVRLYISHDSPHQGSNVPLGFQAMAIHAQNTYFKVPLVGSIKFIDGSNASLLFLNYTPAAKQLLSNRIDMNYILDNTIFQQWQTELSNLGYPQSCRNIAISNGSECGSAYPILPGGNLFLFDGYYKPTFLGELLAMAVSPITGVLIDFKVGLLSLIPGSSKVNIHFEANSMVAGGGNNLYSGKIVYKKKILWLINSQTTLTQKTYTAVLGFNSIDQFPGGFFRLPETYQVSAPDEDLYKGSYVFSIKSGFSFIPTTSALDIGKGQVVLNQTDYYQPYVGATPPPAPKNTPFANFITAFSGGAGLNEEHISFTQRNGKWLADELNVVNPLPQANCSAFCNLSSGNIVGPATLCGTTNYSLSNLPMGATITWYASGSIQVNGLNNQNFVSIKQISNGSGTISAKISSGSTCGDKWISRNIISSGAPAYQVIQGQYYDYAPAQIEESKIVLSENYNQGTGITFSVPYVNGITYNWKVNSTIYPVNDDNTLTIFAPQCGYGYPTYVFYEVELIMSNICGSTTVCKTFGFYCSPTPHLEEIGGCGIFDVNSPILFLVYPNPAANELKVTYQNMQSEDAVVSESINYIVELYNANGVLQPVSQIQNLQGDKLINTSTLPNGIYFLHIKQGDQLIKKQVIIQH